MSERFVVVCLNPTIQNTFTLASLRPGQVNRVIEQRMDASGKGVNVARVLTQLGEDTVHLTHGGGRHLQLLRSLCATDNVALRVVEGNVEIRHCHTLLSADDRRTTEIVEPGYDVSADLEARILAAYRELLPSAHTVIITGSMAPGFSDTVYPTMVAEARAAGARSILDIRGSDLVATLPEHPTLVKLNLNEFSQTFGPEELPEETAMSDVPAELVDRVINVAREHNVELVVSNGRRSLIYVDGDSVRTIDPPAAKPVNAVGSGDALTAGIAAGLNRGQPLVEAITLGMRCAAQNVGLLKPGAIREAT